MLDELSDLTEDIIEVVGDAAGLTVDFLASCIHYCYFQYYGIPPTKEEVKKISKEMTDNHEKEKLTKEKIMEMIRIEKKN